MEMHAIVQGTDEWDLFRFRHFGASEAPMMLGISSKATRNELLAAKSLGLAREFSEWVQERILGAGHAAEAAAGPAAATLGSLLPQPRWSNRMMR